MGAGRSLLMLHVIREVFWTYIAELDNLDSDLAVQTELPGHLNCLKLRVLVLEQFLINRDLIRLRRGLILRYTYKLYNRLVLMLSEDIANVGSFHGRFPSGGTTYSILLRFFYCVHR